MEFHYEAKYEEVKTILMGRVTKLEWVGSFITPRYDSGKWCCDKFYELFGDWIDLTRKTKSAYALIEPPCITIKGLDYDYRFSYCPFCGEEITLSRYETKLRMSK